VSFGWLLLLVTAASYRLTRLVVEDSFPPALWLRERLTGENIAVRRWRWVPEWLTDLVSCRWCASVWVSGGVTLLTALWTDVPLPLLVWAVAASGAAWISHLEDYFVREE
jgi:hypothetical protein